MLILLIVCISINFLQLSDAYVVLQVRKQDNNHSNIDALIHKVVPSDKFEKFAQNMVRKQFHDKATDEKKSEQSSNENEVKIGGKSAEAFSLSVDEKNTDPNLMKFIDLAMKKFSKDGAPVLRANNQEIKPKTIKFRTGESSVLYEINSKSLISGLEEFLSSKMVRNYLDILTRKAAIVYRSMRASNQ